MRSVSLDFLQSLEHMEMEIKEEGIVAAEWNGRSETDAININGEGEREIELFSPPSLSGKNGMFSSLFCKDLLSPGISQCLDSERDFL